MPTSQLWIKDPKNRRAIPHRLEECGYSPVRNPDAKDGLWKINGRRQAVYAQIHMTPRDQLALPRREGNGRSVVQSVKSVVFHYAPNREQAPNQAGNVSMRNH